jgi:transketolase
MHTVKPLDTSALRQCCRETDALFTLEEHSRIGGLGSAVGEWIADDNLRFPLFSFGTRDSFAHVSGSQEYLRAGQGLSAPHIADAIGNALRLAVAC